jgi:hypothetical protein
MIFKKNIFDRKLTSTRKQRIELKITSANDFILKTNFIYEKI